MTIRIFSLIALFSLSSFTVVAAEVSGRVFHDVNANGQYDKGEPLLRGIPVSDGREVVLTSKQGGFTLRNVEPDQYIFPILPASWSVASDNNIATAVLGKLTHQGCDFPVQKRASSSHFRFAVLGDVQVDSSEELSYTNRTLFPELFARKDIDMALVLGDVVNNRPDLAPALEHSFRALSFPSYFVAGNHDRGTLKERTSTDDTRPDAQQLAAHYRSFGLSTYAFNRGDVHFICLNNILPSGAKGYEPVLDEAQLQFVEADLRHVAPSQLVVIAGHAPFFSLNNKEELYKLIEHHPNVLFLSAHLHAVMRCHDTTSTGRLLHEVVVGAPCGQFWRGEYTLESVPLALQQCGAPRGYFFVDINTSNYTIAYKGIQLPDDYGMRVWIAGTTDTLSRYAPDESMLQGRDILVNIFAGGPRTSVQFRIDGGEWTPMHSADITDPEVSRLRRWGQEKVLPTRYSTRSVLRSKASPHMWQAQYPESLATGMHQLEIQAEDEFGLFTTHKEMFERR